MAAKCFGNFNINLKLLKTKMAYYRLFIRFYGSNPLCSSSSDIREQKASSALRHDQTC
jgi:hypothetical protein